MTRRKLHHEHRALQFHNMRVRFGRVVRNTDRIFFARNTDTCIDCGWTINVNDRAVPASWLHRSISGFYAHVTCHGLPSEWLTNTDFPVVIGEGVFPEHLCKPHRRQVTARVLCGDYIRYVCPACIEENNIQ